ncbi:hypothetical protein WBG78_21725 [Chryseolinea sp. T2]|uniref:ankyrin repeat domain-containing protein n=1 Tax=Chryseolinea sp. T2 TaxID=3129255 RepID=UPI003078A4FA
MSDIRTLIERVDIGSLRLLLARHPELANKGIGLKDRNEAVAHPLHRLCDGVFEGVYTDASAWQMAQVFVAAGANVNGVDLRRNQDSPLTAAASLSADQTGMYYVDIGASVTHCGCHGGTALHWAAWCGRDKLVAKLIWAGSLVNTRCTDFESTPLFWAVHGCKKGGLRNQHHQYQCVKLLIEAGAHVDTRNKEGVHVLELLDDTDAEMRALLS